MRTFNPAGQQDMPNTVGEKRRGCTSSVQGSLREALMRTGRG